MTSSLPIDPFGLDEAERLLWSAVLESGIVGDLLRRQTADRVAKELAILDNRIAGIPQAGSLYDVRTLHYFLARLSVPTAAVTEALEHWRTANANVEPFLTGRCHEFALAGHEATGWPIKVIVRPSIDDHENGKVVHVVLECPDGQVMDIRGLQDAQTMGSHYGMRPARWLEASPEDVLARGDLAEVVDLAEARAAFRTVVGDGQITVDCYKI